jgi:GntR family transcriptional regulator, arabinose operon transcriptional repressor
MSSQSETHDLFRDTPSSPKYLLIKRHLQEEMASGRLKPGQALPSETVLVETLKVARNTVRQALGELEREGVLRRVRGKGTFVSEDTPSGPLVGHDLFVLIAPEPSSTSFVAMLHGFEGVCREQGYQTVIRSTEDDVAKQADAILQLIDSEFVGGVALLPTADMRTPAYHVRPLQQRGIPVVLCHRGVPGVEAPVLALRGSEMGRLAGETLVKFGHRRVAFFARLPKMTIQPTGLEEGLRQAVRAAGGDVPREFVHYGHSQSFNLEDHEQEIFEALEQMCSRPDRPTAIMATFDPLAEMLYLLLGRLGLRVPEDISLMSVSASRRDGPIRQRLGAVMAPSEEIGRRAAELLDEMRRHKRPLNNSEEIVIPLSVTEGRTLGPPPVAGHQLNLSQTARLAENSRNASACDSEPPTAENACLVDRQ